VQRQIADYPSGYNPPQFIIDAAKGALDRVECNQYSPTKGRPRLKKAIADAYTPFFGRKLDPETEVTITTRANEGEPRKEASEAARS
jgi:kynurenine aminotransferase